MLSSVQHSAQHLSRLRTIPGLHVDVHACVSRWNHGARRRNGARNRSPRVETNGNRSLRARPEIRLSRVCVCLVTSCRALLQDERSGKTDAVFRSDLSLALTVGRGFLCWNARRASERERPTKATRSGAVRPRSRRRRSRRPPAANELREKDGNVRHRAPSSWFFEAFRLPETPEIIVAIFSHSSRPDSALEAFRHNPTDGSLAPPVVRPSAEPDRKSVV